jgi:hypothetical protein
MLTPTYKCAQFLPLPVKPSAGNEEVRPTFHFHLRTRNQFVVLPPAGLRGSRVFQQIEFDTQRHDRLMSEMQRLRGKTYLEDGAIKSSDLTPDGRHETADDERAWHVLSLDSEGRVGACLRFLDERHLASFGGLWVSHAAIARCPSNGWKLRKAVEAKVQLARVMRVGFGSVGGWAAAPEERRSAQPVSVILATYALLELLGGCIGVATATFRHQSATILRKIGLSPITWSGGEIPPYFDPQYGCEMEVLEFDSSHPNPKYRDAVKRFAEQLVSAPVVCREAIEQTPSLRRMAAVA